MNQKNNFYSLAELLEYPQDGFCNLLNSCETMLNNFDNEVKEIKNLFNKFSSFVKENSKEKLQELYVKTFELNPACTPYIGVHIFGEDGYKRGTLMTRLKQAYKENNLNNNSELPDHISQILKLASSLNDKDKYNTLLAECVIHPINLMLKELENKNNNSNPYKYLLTAIKKIAELSIVKELRHA
ncbi:MAG: molecular chaperone TorD family protein [Candidatus Melainabacteria bacterium]|nr:molecular chaperone TorD family protein [Candidatus Melainabacteria bacterium]